ncbi:hypothetical protein [Microvirga massiliensis]|uniref:hypothetical protein n=1 Tax=Microvirga massiliensis TaxID=1033741 RepID=UPI00062BD56D|nr:hypothetical protein [Microvirga massiliensis]
MNVPVRARDNEVAQLHQLFDAAITAGKQASEPAGRLDPAAETTIRRLIQEGSRYLAALGFDPIDDDARHLAHDLGAYFPDVASVHARIYSEITEAVLASPAAAGPNRPAVIAGLIYAMLIASRGERFEGLIDFVRSIFPPGSSIAFTTMLPVDTNKDLRGFTWHLDQDPEAIKLRAFLAEAEDNARNIYICTNPVHETFCGSKPADKDVRTRIHGILDIDRNSVASGMTEAQARSHVDATLDAAIAKIGTRPCARVCTGNGAHGWFKVPADINREAWADTCAGTGSDAVYEESRLGRASWTFNVPAEGKRNRHKYRPRLAYVVGAPDPSALAVDPEHLASTFPPRKGSPKLPTAGARTSVAGHGAGGLTADEVHRLEAVWPLIKDAAELRDLPDELRNQAEAALVGDQFLRDRYHGHAGPLVDRFGTPRLAGFMEGDRSAATMALISLARRAGLTLEVTAALAVTQETGELLPNDKHDDAGRMRQFGRCWSKATPPEETEDPSSSGGRGTALRRAEDTLLAEAGVELWRSGNSRFITLPTSNGIEHFDLKSNEALDAIFAALRRLPDRSLHLPPRAVAELAEALHSLAYDAPEFPVGVRSAPHAGAGGDCIYLNLANDAGEVIEITSTGYQVVPGNTAPVRFPRRSSLRPPPMPAGSVSRRDFLPVIRQHIVLPPRLSETAIDPGVQAEAALLLFLANAVRRDGEVAHLLLTGPAGAGKTTTALRLKDLVDPTNPPLSAAPRDALGLIALAKGQGITCLDNTSNIGPDAADLFCGFATGTAHTARQLYSNGDLYSVELLAPVMFTTVLPDLSSRPDLVSRVVRIALDRRATATPRALLDAAWQVDRPALLAALLDILVGALAGWQAVAAEWTDKPLDRLAGPLVFAEAAARAIGWKPNLLIEAMREGWREQQADAAAGDPLVAALLGLVGNIESRIWEGTMADLLPALTGPFGGQGKLNIRSPQGLGQAIARLDPGALADLGLEVARRRVNGRLVVTITKTSASDETVKGQAEAVLCPLL